MERTEEIAENISKLSQENKALVHCRDSHAYLQKNIQTFKVKVARDDQNETGEKLVKGTACFLRLSHLEGENGERGQQCQSQD